MAIDTNISFNRINAIFNQRFPHTTICVLFALVISCYCFNPNLSSWFGLIDDHETIKYLGSDGVLYISEIPGFLLETEVGHPFESRRFRPIYYSLRLIETALWRDNVAIWYGVRMAAFAAFVSLMAYYFTGWFGWGLGGALSFATLAAPYWADIFGRLGPPENYTVPAMGWVAFGLSGLIGTGRSAGVGSVGRWLALLFGCLIAIGVKENYLFLLPLLVWAVFILLQARRWRLASLALLVLVLCTITIFIFLLANFVGGNDFYGDDTSLKGRLKLLLLYFRYYRPAFNYVIGVAALLAMNVILGGYLWWRSRRVSPELRWLGVSVVCLGLSAVQYLFYKGLWPHGTSRYDFPGLIFLGIAVVCWLKVGLRLLRWRWLQIGLPLMLCLLLSLLSIGWIQEVRQLSVNTLNRTNVLKQRLDRIAEFTQQNPTMPIVVVANDPFDFEAVDSIVMFFEFKSIANPKVIRIGFPVPYKSEDNTTSNLAQRLQDRSINGNGGYLPLAEIDLSKGCISFGLSGLEWSECLDLDGL